MKQKLQIYLENLMLFLTGVYLIWQFSTQTTFYLNIPPKFHLMMFGALAFTAAFRLLILGLTRKKVWLSIAVAFVYCAVYWRDRYGFLLFLSVLTVGLVEIDYRKILKVFLIAVGTYFLVTILAGVTGSIDNFIYVRTERGIRSSWGICYPTDLASTFLYLLVFLWVSWKQLPDWCMLLIGMFSVGLSAFIACSSTSLICSVLFLLLVLYHLLERRFEASKQFDKYFSRGVDVMLPLSFPLLGGGFFALMFLYHRGSSVAYRMDRLLSGRLRLAVEAFQSHGLKPFGTPFDQIGGGFSVVEPSNYNFIDSTYPLILIRYGGVLFLILCIYWVLLTSKAVQIGDRRLALAMALIAFHSFSEHHFIEAHYNILLVMPFASYTLENAEATQKSDSLGKGKVSDQGISLLGKARLKAGLCTAAITLLTGILLLPVPLSGIRTFCELKGLTGGGSKGPAVIFLNLLVILLTAGCIYALYRFLLSFLTTKVWNRKDLGRLLLCIGAAVLFSGELGKSLQTEAVSMQNELEEQSQAIDLITESASGKVYAGTCPMVYQKRFPKLSLSAFAGEELARDYGSTVIMPGGKEYQAFLKRGFLYTKISDRHAVYTSDQAVISELSDAGYHLTSYYSTKQTLNLNYLSRLNRLSYSTEKGIRLQGSEQSIEAGLYLDLFGGRYTVTYRLQLPEKERMEEGSVCRLQIWINEGEKKLLEKEVSTADFSETGEAAVPILFNIVNSKGVEFLVLAGNGRTLYVRGIDLERTPEYDTHVFYDQKLRLIREEYYNTDGSPMMHSGGYYAMEQDYDSAGNIAYRKFLDADGQPVLRTDGYAEVQWQYDVRRRVTREAFFGLSGEPVMISGQQAANEREYDENGNVSVMRYLDTESKPVVSSAGYAEIHRRYNEDKKVIYEEYIGTDGKPLLQTSGYSAMEQEYDVEGNVVRRRFLHENKPVLRTDGYAEVRFEYNGLHQVIRESFMDAEGKLVRLSSGYAVDEREYDTAGNVLVYRYYDEQLQPANVSGYSELHRAYDDRRQVTREEYFGSDGQPVLISNGYAAWERTYTGEGIGRVQSQRFFGVSGEPVLNTDGYFEVQRSFDGNGNTTEERYLGTDGNPILFKNGYAALKRSYNENGTLLEDRFFNEVGEPAVLGAGYSAIRYDYDTDRQLLLTHYLDQNGNEVQAGSSYLHEYLKSLFGRDLTVFISAKDEATASLTPVLLEDLKNLGIQTDLRGRTRNGFYAVITPDEVIEEISPTIVLQHEGTVGGSTYSISSAGYQVGNLSSIVIDGTEYSKNRRGLNIVVYDNVTGKVIDSVSFDTFIQEMTVTR